MTDTSNPGGAPTRSSAANILMWIIPLLLLALIGWVAASALKLEQKVQPKAPEVSEGDFPRTITEANGRKVVIPKKPMRIVAGEAGSADVLSAIMDPSRFAGLPFTVDKYAGNQEWFTAHPEIKRYQAFNAETILALKPDLVLCASFQDAGTFGAVEQAGIPVMRFEAFRTMAGIRSYIESLGRAAGEDEKAKALIAEFDRRLQAVEKAIAGRPKPRVVAYANYNGNGSMVGAGETQDEVIRCAGGINAAAEAGFKGFGNCSYEQLLKFDPDMLLVSGGEGMNSKQVKIILGDETLSKNLKAVKDKRIAVVPGKYYESTTQFIVDAVEILAKQLHPDAFPQPELPAKKEAQP